MSLWPLKTESFYRCRCS